MIKPNTLLPATKFFKHNKALIEYLGNYEWNITYDYGETLKQSINLSTSSLATNWTWVVIENGKIVIKNEVMDNRVPLPEHKSAFEIPVSKFPLETRIGWRGPMIEWQHLANLPKVYWKD